MFGKLIDNSYKSHETTMIGFALGVKAIAGWVVCSAVYHTWTYTEMTVMDTSIAAVMKRYRQVYLKLYQREPRELRDLGTGWVLVNGARMQVGELVRLTDQMQNEYRQAMTQKRNVIMRLLTWLREN